MKKIIFTFFTIITVIFTFIIFFLSHKGYETDNFNKIISKNIKKNKDELNIDFTKIKIKLDIKRFQLFLSTEQVIQSFASDYILTIRLVATICLNL